MLQLSYTKLSVVERVINFTAEYIGPLDGALASEIKPVYRWEVHFLF